jgi:hypothetical protein
VLADRALIEPLLRQSADLALDATATTEDLADQLLTRGAWIATARTAERSPTDAA